MRVSTVALVTFLSINGNSSHAFFVGPSRGIAISSKRSSASDKKNHYRYTLPVLQSLTAPVPPGSRNNRSETTELDSTSVPVTGGKILEGGKVIDFESIRGPSQAEHALQLAKDEVSKMKQKTSTKEILGINEDVLAEVGHDLGAFATTEQIQKCAAYLRSNAAPSFFEKRSGDDVTSPTRTFTQEEKTQLHEILNQAYVESGEVTSAFAKTFYMGTQLLPEAPREAIWAIYVWCRRTDEIVDAPRDSNEEMLRDLGSWEMRLENLWKYGEVQDVFDLCLLDVLVKYPTLPITPFVDMIRGMLMDVPQLGQDRYESFDELHLYCYRVAGTVGLMSLPVFGCADGYDEIIAK